MWQRPPGTLHDYPDLAIREVDYKLLVNIDGSGTELYNIREDETGTTKACIILTGYNSF